MSLRSMHEEQKQRRKQESNSTQIIEEQSREIAELREQLQISQQAIERQKQQFLSEKQELELTVQQLVSTVQQQEKKIAEQAEQIEKLNNSDKQLKKAEKMQKENDKRENALIKREQIVEENEKAYNRKKAQLQEREENMEQRIDQEAEKRAIKRVQDIEDEKEKWKKRLIKFVVAAISILMIYSSCVTGAWISDHISVFVGQTGIASFFVSVGNGFASMFSGIGYLLNYAIQTMQGVTSELVAKLVVYSLSVVLVLGGGFFCIRKVFPKLKRNFGKLLYTYEQNGELGYKKAMTVSLCVISLCFAILFAEYAMVNVIFAWLMMSVSFNLAYHLFTYEK